MFFILYNMFFAFYDKLWSLKDIKGYKQVFILFVDSLMFDLVDESKTSFFCCT